MVGERIKRNVDAAVDIATNSLDKSAGIVKGAGEILKGNVADGLGEIAKNSTDIATHASKTGFKIATQNVADAHRDTAAAAETAADRLDERRRRKEQAGLESPSGE
ncbi:Rv1893 family protein [Tsukamurella soli]|uniref:MT0933-like antitoxin protein n=1 Tax=Tsukamurella soli TaxID=644556 RepID=A0ABP8JU77_9ACTN